MKSDDEGGEQADEELLNTDTPHVNVHSDFCCFR